jgi:hypothetical protein
MSAGASAENRMVVADMAMAAVLRGFPVLRGAVARLGAGVVSQHHDARRNSALVSRARGRHTADAQEMCRTVIAESAEALSAAWPNPAGRLTIRPRPRLQYPRRNGKIW